MGVQVKVKWFKNQKELDALCAGQIYGNTHGFAPDYPEAMICLDEAPFAANKHHASATVLHELLHVISSGLHIQLTETDVRCLEQGLYALFQDNPALSLVWSSNPRGSC